MKLPLWADGAVFGLLLVPVTLFLKIICPVKVGCFADPFLVILFSPLMILELFIKSGNFSYSTEILFLVVFWGLIWTSLASLFRKIISSNTTHSLDLDVSQ